MLGLLGLRASQPARAIPTGMSLHVPRTNAEWARPPDFQAYENELIARRARSRHKIACQRVQHRRYGFLAASLSHQAGDASAECRRQSLRRTKDSVVGALGAERAVVW